METSTKLGRVSIAPRGEYDPSASYERLDLVRYEGSGYLVLRPVQGVTPADGQDYMLLVLRGEDGQDGEDGQPGKDGAAGSSIARIERTGGIGAPGEVDTYTITLTDGSTTTFQVRNGADGQGAGDMTRAVYDPQGKNTDIFTYVDDAVKNVAIEIDSLPVRESVNPVSSGGTFTALERKQDTLTGLPGQVVGFDEEGHAVPQEVVDSEAVKEAQETADLALKTAQEASSAAAAAQALAQSAGEAAASAAEDAQAALEAAQGAATMEQVDAAIQAAVLDSWEGSY